MLTRTFQNNAEWQFAASQGKNVIGMVRRNITCKEKELNVGPNLCVKQ